MNRKILTTLLIVICCAAPLTASPRLSGEKGGKGGRAMGYIEGTVVGIGGRLGGGTRPFKLVVDDFTNADQVRQLTEALRSGGEGELLKALSKMKAGRIEVGGGVGVPANAIIATPLADGGTKITVLYERAVGLYELRRGARSEDYRLGEAEIYLDGSGKAEGTFVPAAQLRLGADGSWQVENFGEFPARIVGIKVKE